MHIYFYSGEWTRAFVANNPDKVFLFGDNIRDSFYGYVPSKTQAVIRCLPNAIGIPTKHDRWYSTASYFTDDDYELFKSGVDLALTRAKQSGKDIVIPKAGIGTGKAELPKRAPKCYKYLHDELTKLLIESKAK